MNRACALVLLAAACAEQDRPEPPPAAGVLDAWREGRVEEALAALKERTDGDVYAHPVLVLGGWDNVPLPTGDDIAVRIRTLLRQGRRGPATRLYLANRENRAASLLVGLDLLSRGRANSAVVPLEKARPYEPAPWLPDLALHAAHGMRGKRAYSAAALARVRSEHAAVAYYRARAALAVGDEARARELLTASRR